MSKLATHQNIIQAAGLAPGNSLRLRVLTFNLGENKKSKAEWEQEFAQWPMLTDKQYDLLSVALQEDFATQLAQGKLRQALTEFMAKQGYAEAVKASTTPAKINEPFAVKGVTFVRKDIYDSAFLAPNNAREPYVSTKTLCLGAGLKKVACTKATVGIKTVLGGPYSLDYTFLASHMPINTKVDDLGYAERVEAMKQSVAKVVLPLTPATPKNRLLVWAGDLNFRTDAGGKDQLTEALRSEQGFGISLREDEARLLQMKPTCKMVPCTDQACPICRQRVSESDPTCYQTETKKGQRVPSRCDRVLHAFVPRSSASSVTQTAYNAFSAPAVRISDHNAVVADFVLNL